VDPHAGIAFHARRGAKVERGQPLATLYATKPELLAEAIQLTEGAITVSDTAPAPVTLVSRVFTRDTAEEYLKNAMR
jgi:pyrimidine-nucleoside phosphorylase